MIRLKNREELKKMRTAGAAVSEVLARLSEEAGEGVSTWELNEIAEKMCSDGGFRAAFKGYANYPGSVCFAVNEEIVHGIPSREKVLREGDIVGIDFGAFLDGYYADSAVTVAVGRIAPVAEKLLRVTEASLYRGIDMMTAANRILDISKEIQAYVESEGFSVVRDFVGHGIGRELHEEPQVPNFVPPRGTGRGVRLRRGMVIAIEPMVNEGSERTRILEDGWTAVTYDGKLSAHFEHTVALTDNGPEVLTERLH